MYELNLEHGKETMIAYNFRIFFFQIIFVSLLQQVVQLTH